MIQAKAVMLSTVKESDEMEESMVVNLKEEKPKEKNEQPSQGIFSSIRSMMSFGGAKPKAEELQNLSDDEDDERNRSMEKCDSDELEGDMNLSDDEQEAANYRSALKAKKKN